MKDNIKNDTTINISNYIYSNNIKVFIKTHYIHISNIYSTGRFSYKDFKNIRFMKPYNDTLFINNLILKNQLREYTSPDTLK